jgi:hypothetical protein
MKTTIESNLALFALLLLLLAGMTAGTLIFP